MSTLVGARALSNAQQKEVARLMLQATPHFYGLIPGGESTVLPIIESLLGAKGTDLEGVNTALEDDDVVGAFCAFPGKELRLRQLMSLMVFQRALDAEAWEAFKAAATDFDKTLAPVPIEAYYLARISIMPRAQGRGVARELLGAVINQAGERSVCLHVHRSNLRAIGVYEAAGFTATPGAADFLLMTLTHGRT